MDHRHYKDQSTPSPSFKVLQRHDSKSHSVGALSTLLSREQKLQDDVRRHSSHGVAKALIPRGSRALSLQSPCHYGSAPTISSKQLLHESLSEGSLSGRKLVPNISLNEAATIPFDLLYELAEKLNPLGHDTLNKLALLIGMTQKQFDKLYKSAINPARSLLTEGERFLNSLEDLKVALIILELTEAVDLIQKHQLESSRKEPTAKTFPHVSTRIVSSDSDTDHSDENIDRPVFMLDDRQDESTDDFKSGRVEGYTVMQGDPERSEASILNIPDGVVQPDCTGAFQQFEHFPQHKEAKTAEYEPQGSRSCAKSPSKHTKLPIHSPYMEALQSIRSEGSQVDSGYGSTEHSALSSDTCNSATCMSDDIDGEKNITSSSKPFTQSSDVFCTSGLIGERGGVLYIPNTSISLLIPEGALKRPEMIQLKVITDHTVKGCAQSASHPRLTPLVSCEPDGLEFLEAAELTLPHCGIVLNPEETVEVYVRRGGGGEEWKRDEYASKNAVLMLNTCNIRIKHFCDFDVFVRNTGGNIIGKKMRTFPMADCLEQASDDILLSLWMCNDYDQEYNVIVKEKQDLVTNVLLDQYTCYMLEASKQSVNVEYCNRSTDMWTLENHQEEIGYNQLWYGSKAKATFRMKCSSSTGGGKLNGTLMIKQKEHCESTKFELQCQVRYLLKEHIMQKEEPYLQTQQSYTSQYSVVSVRSQPSPSEQAAVPSTPQLFMVRRDEDEIYFPPTKPNERHLHIYMPSSSNEQSNIISPQSPPTFQFPYDLALQLSRHLNGDDALGNDWRLLASNLGYSSLDISSFERCQNPTKDMLLDAYNKKRLRDFDQLHTTLTNLERLDAVETLEQYLKVKNPNPGLMAIEGPQNSVKPELSQQCSGEFSISTMEQLSATARRVDHAMLVQQLPAIQGTDVTSSEHHESDQKHYSYIGGDQGHHMVLPSLPEIPSERGTCSLPCHTSTPLRKSSTTEDGEMVHQSMKFVRGQGSDSGIDSPDISRQQSRRRITRSVTLAPNFTLESNDSGPASLISELSLVDTKSSQGIASQSSSEDSGLVDSPSSEDLVNSPPLEKLNNCFSP